MMLDPEDKDSFLAKGDPPAADAKSGSGRQRNTPPRVLVIDDESTIRMALRRFFGRMGWDVAEAPDGKQALDLLLKSAPPDAASKTRDPSSSEAYDMVLSDVRMPGLNGIQLHERLKAESTRHLAETRLLDRGHRLRLRPSSSCATSAFRSFKSPSSFRFSRSWRSGWRGKHPNEQLGDR